METELDVYTGTIIYRDVTFTFVFDKEELRLVPPTGKAREVRHWLLKSIGNGVYTNGDPLYIEEPFLSGKINETGQTIIFIPEIHKQVGSYNSVLFVAVSAYIIFKYERDSIDRISFQNSDLDYIFLLNRLYQAPHGQTMELSLSGQKLFRKQHLKRKLLWWMIKQLRLILVLQGLRMVRLAELLYHCSQQCFSK